MKEFVQYMPTKVVFGKGTEEETGRLIQACGASKVLAVYGGGSVKRSGLLERVRQSCEAEGIVFKELSGVRPNPRLSLAREGVEKAVKAAEIMLTGDVDQAMNEFNRKVSG